MKCLRCHKNQAVIHPVYGVTYCEQCRRETARYVVVKDKRFKPTDKMLEYYATPFWKHMGLPPKPEEKVMEKYMKSKNLTYLDLQRIRARSARYQNTELINKMEKGELHGEPDVTYNRR